MSAARPIDPTMPANRLLKFTAFLCETVAYLTFLVAIVHAIGFASGLFVPKTIDTGLPARASVALVIDLLLMSLFAIQHGVMARKPFERCRTQYNLKSVERSTYVLFSSLALLLLFRQWRPIPAIAWHLARGARYCRFASAMNVAATGVA